MAIGTEGCVSKRPSRTMVAIASEYEESVETWPQRWQVAGDREDVGASGVKQRGQSIEGVLQSARAEVREVRRSAVEVRHVHERV